MLYSTAKGARRTVNRRKPPSDAFSALLLFPTCLLRHGAVAQAVTNPLCTLAAGLVGSLRIPPEPPGPGALRKGGSGVEPTCGHTGAPRRTWRGAGVGLLF